MTDAGSMHSDSPTIGMNDSRMNSMPRVSTSAECCTLWEYASGFEIGQVDDDGYVPLEVPDV